MSELLPCDINFLAHYIMQKVIHRSTRSAFLNSSLAPHTYSTSITPILDHTNFPCQSSHRYAGDRLTSNAPPPLLPTSTPNKQGPSTHTHVKLSHSRSRSVTLRPHKQNKAQPPHPQVSAPLHVERVDLLLASP